MRTLTWKRRFFGGTYEIYDGSIKVGEILPKPFSYSLDGYINSSKYSLKVNGFFKPKCLIIDSFGNEIGSIKFSTWFKTADISLNGKIYQLRFNSFWGTKFSIISPEGQSIDYWSRTSGGEINSMIEDNLSILAGLFAYNYYYQITLTVISFTLITTNLPHLFRLFH